MKGFLRATLNRQKLRALFVSTALSNFASYVAGSLVTLLFTRHEIERRAIGNLFGVLPRKKIVVHMVPHWLEWLLALIVGYLVMEAVRYWFDHRKYAALLGVLRPKRETKIGRSPTDRSGAHAADAGAALEAPPPAAGRKGNPRINMIRMRSE
jgi:hypothetical protein